MSERTPPEGTTNGSSARDVLLIGDGVLPDTTERALRSGGAHVVRLREPSDRDVRGALAEQVDVVVVVSRSDVASLRFALVVEHARPGIPLVVTIFARGVAAQVEATVENVRVLSMGEIAAPCFAGPLLDRDLIALTHSEHGAAAVRLGESGPEFGPLEAPGPSRGRRLAGMLASMLRPYDVSARILLAGLLGFLLVLVIETAVTALVKDLSLVDAVYATAKTAVTVGPNPYAEQGPDWFKLFSAAAMLLTLGFTAVLTAGLVNRLLDRRLTGILGRRAVPRRDHVVVVGLGQVGLRLCLLLRDVGVPVVAVERDPDVPNVARAKDHGVPVVVGRGSSQMLLGRLSLRRARALAAVTSDEVENIAVAVAAQNLRPDLHIALRAGDGDATSDIRSLFHIGIVRDVYRVAGTTLAAAALGSSAREAFPHEGTMYLIEESGEIVPFVPTDGPGAERHQVTSPSAGATR